MEQITHNNNTFMVIDFVPSNYQIWNIGKNMIDGYLPLCECGGYDSCQVNTRSLKAIKIEGAQTILSAIGRGQNTIEQMETYISRYKNSKKQCTLNHVRKLQEALKVMYLIKWN